MKALSLTEPWAMLVVWIHGNLLNGEAVAEKEYETRSWRWTPKPQEILIHASKGFPGWAKELCYEKVFREAMARHGCLGPSGLPLGAIVGKVSITACFQTENVRDRISGKERAFGDYSDGRIAIKLSNPVALAAPVPCKGALGLWTVPADVEALVKQQLLVAER